MHQLSSTVDRKFTEIIDLNDWEIETPSGWKDLISIMQTVEYDVWRVEFEDGLWIEGADDHILMKVDDSECFIKDLVPGDQIQSINTFSVVKSVQQIPRTENMYDVEVDSNEHVFYSNGLVSHNTTTVGAFLLHESIFKNRQVIGILANKGDTARGILARIKDMFENLPWFLKPGVVEWNKGRIELSNGTQVISAATTSAGVRSYSMNCIAGESMITIEDDDGIIRTEPIEITYANLSNYKYRYVNKDNGKSTMFENSNDVLNVNERTLDNKYEKIYNAIINRALNESRDIGKYEKHHIIPLSISNDNSKNNIVKLTLREHFICHKLLVKMYSGSNKCKMLKALYMMSNTRGLMLSSRIYEECKSNLSEDVSKRMKLYYSDPKNREKSAITCSKTMLGVPKSEEQKRRISEANSGKDHYWQDKINKNPEKIRKTAEKHTGMKRSISTRKRQSESKKRALLDKGSVIVGKGKFYIFNTETKQIKRVDDNSDIQHPWIKGSGPSKTRNTFFIRNSETGQIKKVPLGFEYNQPWYKGMK